MLFLGLLLLACTAAFTGLVLADNLSGGPDYRVTVLGEHIATMNTLAVFCAGLGLALIFGLGCLMALTGGVLRRRKRRQLLDVRREARATARERDALAARLEDRDTGPAPMAAPPSAAPPTGGPEPEGGYGTPRNRPDHMGGPDDGGAGSTRVETPPTRHRRSGLHLFGH